MDELIEVVVNAAGGSFSDDGTEAELRAALDRRGLRYDLKLARSGDEIRRFAREAADGNARIVVGGGGDGTISTVASELSRTGKILGVLPLGTLNNFSKDIGIPQDIEGAVDVIADGVVRDIDLAELNGRKFINNSSIGLYPRIVRNRVRGQMRWGYGKWRAALWATLRMFRISPFLKVGIVVNGRFFLRKTPFVFVGNNEYEMELYNIGRRSTLDDGKLCVYFLHRGGRLGVLLLLLRTIIGTVRQWRDFEEVLTDSITIQTRRKRMHVAFDGEVETVLSPLRYRILPKALKVMVPKQIGEEVSG